MCSSVTLPSASNLRSSCSVSRCLVAARARLPSPFAAVMAAAAAPICNSSRRLVMDVSMPDARHAQLLPGVDRREIELEVTVFLGVGRQLVGPDGDVAPGEAPADVPDLVEAGAPGREMIELALLLAEPLAADPLEPAACRVVAVAAGKVECAEFCVRERAPALVGGLGIRARQVD